MVRHHSQARGSSDALTNASRKVLFSPVLHTSHSVDSWWQVDVASIFEGPRLAVENEALRSQVANLMDQNRTLADQADENSRLRSLLNFKSRDTRQLMPAEVLALKPFSERDSAIFSRGGEDEVTLKEPALDEYGNLVGQVTAVSSNTCDVLLLTDTLSSAGARVIPANSGPKDPDAASAGAVGICVGDHSDNLQFNDLPPNSEIEVGDLVVTSGLGGISKKAFFSSDNRTILTAGGHFARRLLAASRPQCSHCPLSREARFYSHHPRMHLRTDRKSLRNSAEFVGWILNRRSCRVQLRIGNGKPAPHRLFVRKPAAAYHSGFAVHSTDNSVPRDMALRGPVLSDGA